jgi:hypothetical protein
MDRQEWVSRCIGRLHVQWPRAARVELEELAVELYGQTLRHCEQPESAAFDWLKQGIPPEGLRRGGD